MPEIILKYFKAMSGIVRDRGIRRQFLALTILFFLATPSAAQDYKKGLKAYEQGDFSAALQEWRPLAEQGDAKAQTTIGSMYATDRGVQQDFVRAYMLHAFAVEHGSRFPRFIRDVRVARDDVARRMAPEKIDAAHKLARD
jgi:hypothetical protein